VVGVLVDTALMLGHNRTMDYKETQWAGFGWSVLVLGLVVFVGAVVEDYQSSTASDLVILAVMSVAFIVGVVFSRLSVVVTDDRIVARFLFGWPRREIKIADVVAVRRAPNLRRHGMGIRKTPGGATYNVWAFDAVELELASGDVFGIGSIEPDALYDAISSRTASLPAQHSDDRHRP